MKSALWSVVKYLLAATLLYVILKHADMEKVMTDLRKIPPFQLLLAFVFISLAQVASAMRMRFFFLASGFPMHRRYAIILFYVGAFYNFLLPGGIGGDAYKVILARRRMQVTAKEGIRIMLADRASGLCVIMLTMMGGMLTFDWSAVIPYGKLLLCMAIVILMLGYFCFSKWLLKKSWSTMADSLLYSLVVQSLWVAGVVTVCVASGVGAYAVEYIVLYCAASIIGMLPISVGGLGIKEMTYFGGAQWMQQYLHSGVDGRSGVAISLCLFVLMFVTSLPGVLWLNHVEKANYV